MVVWRGVCDAFRAIEEARPADRKKSTAYREEARPTSEALARRNEWVGSSRIEPSTDVRRR